MSKNIFQIITTVLMLTTLSMINTATATEPNQPGTPATPGDRVVLHVNNPNKIHLLKNSTVNLRDELGDSLDIIVVINGPAITRLIKSSPDQSEIESIVNMGIRIEACHNAIRRHEINTDLLIPGVQALNTDGNIAVLRYQQKGYVYIKI